MKGKHLGILTLLIVVTALWLTACGAGRKNATTTVSISTASVPAAQVSVAYNQALTATGGAAPYNWTLASGSLPAGLTLSPAGVISGTPTAAGVSTFTVRVTDSSSPPETATMTLTLTVNAAGAPLSITTTSPLAPGTVGAAYSLTLGAAGGTAPYSWAIAAGPQPTGLTLSAAGVLSGTPTVAGTFNFTATVTDSAAPPVSVSQAFSVTIVPAGAALAITSTSPLTSGSVGTAYSTTLNASGGTAPYSWAITAGTQPTGLTLSAAGVLSGTPTVAGTFNFTATVTDSAAPPVSVSQVFALTIASGAPGQPTGVTATPGTNSVTITWPAVAGATSYNLYWSASPGVTTGTGTLITGVTSPYRHSRLTATPTWLAANTPYYYILVAVNASGSSAPSAEVTATTSATDGVALYGTTCATGGCHPPLATYNHRGASLATVQNAIATNIGGMGSLSGVSLATLQAIVDVTAVGF